MAERPFGPYRLVRQIAVGGMAEIHLAKTRGIAGFEKFVALKMIHPNFAMDEQFIQMLIDEAKIAVQLQHVNIAQTFDLGRVGDTYYITMEYVDGADLYKILRRGSEQDLDMPLDVCAFAAKEMATGLDHAHRKRGMDGQPLGIVHRDVSPQNVLISHAGEVKLVDFGIAKATMRARQTQVGVIKGKYYYMSPEQAWGDPLDHRSDVFSCGIVLYEMLTGQMLYLEEDLQKLLDMVRRANIAPPTRLRRDIPPQLERIVMHALQKSPADRYQSAADFATDLERFLHTYSPVFTASKLAAHLRKAVGEPVPLIEPQGGAPAPRNPNHATQPIDRRELAQDRSDITDENSVIFRVAELRAQAERDASQGTVDRHDDDSTAAELPRATTRRAATAPSRPDPAAPARLPRPPTAPAVGAIPPPRAPTAPVGRPRPPTQPPPSQAARARSPTAPMVPTRVPAQVPTRLPASQMPTVVPAQLQTVVPAPGRARPPTRPPPSPPSPPSPPARPAPRAPARPPTGRPGLVDLATMAGDLGDIEEMTAISEPSFDGASQSDGATGMTARISAGLSDYGDYEPTTVDGGEIDPRVAADQDHPDDQPTITRDGLGVPLPQAVSLSSSETAPRPHGELRSKIRPGAPAHPALAASSPTPAVSALRQPRTSRRTPGGGVPAPHGSVLQAIVGAAGNEPMPTAPMRGPARTSDGVPANLPDAASSGAPTAPFSPPGPPPGLPFTPGQLPNQHQLPSAYAPPQQPGNMVLVAPPTPMPGTVPAFQYPPQLPSVAQQLPPSAQLPPHLMGYGLPQAAQTVAPGSPFQAFPGYGQPAVTFTKQMQAAIELDELPARYQLQAQRSRRVILIVALVALFVGGIGLAVLITREKPETINAALVLDSSPAGAIVTIDGVALSDPTPVRFPTNPGARHEVTMAMPGHVPWKQVILVGSSGGDLTYKPTLAVVVTRLRVVCEPGKADIYIDGKKVGTTPKVIESLDPAVVKTIELRINDDQRMSQTLQWRDDGTADVLASCR